MPAVDTAAESAVRRYLSYLEDPSSVVDAERIGALERELTAATDPIQRLRLLAEIHECRAPDTVRIRQAFLQHAKPWAEAQKIPLDAFTHLGVPDADLRAAGWTVRRRSPDPGRATTPVGVTVAEVERHIAHRTSVFTVADIAAAVGGSPMTLRKAIGNLLDEGAIERLPPEPSGSRGRAPTRYRTCASESEPGPHTS